MIRDYLRAVTGAETREEVAEAFEAVARSMAGNSGGSPWQVREELYRDRVEKQMQGGHSARQDRRE